MDALNQPAARYREFVDRRGYTGDAAQERIVEALQALHDALLSRSHGNAPGERLRRLIGRGCRPVRGIYLWGSVGRGKTWLMNLFYESLPGEDKLRTHFHHFMLDVHARLTVLQGRKNPLRIIARDLAEAYRVICLDEFIVTNITDAMLLSGLLEALFDEGLVLVATSNRPPDELYKNGLQRERFLPAIDLLKQRNRVLQVEGTHDHRVLLTGADAMYYSPITQDTDRTLEQRMRALAPSAITRGQVLTLHGRPLQTRMHAEEIAWFDFEVLCSAPRAAADYIEIARDYHTVLVSGVPVMDRDSDDRARRFIYLIDELYNRNVKLILSAAAEPERLYAGGTLEFPFRRTASRLVEMRSRDYLDKPHRSG